MFATRLLRNQFGELSNFQEVGGSANIGCSFTVAPANAGGKGLTGFTGLGIASAFMHTSQTPATGNPNPAAGYILVNFLQPYSSLLSFDFRIFSPLSGSSVNVTSGLTLGQVYVITSVGTTTAANWRTLGLPTNLVPAVGQAFVAITAALGTGTGTVQTMADAGSTMGHIELVGSSVLTNNTVGGQAILACLAPTDSATTTLALTAPAVGTLLSLSFKCLPVVGSEQI